MNFEFRQYKKPKTVTYAEYALMTWTAWTCFFGIYETWTSVPEAESLMSGQLQGIISASPQQIMEYAVGGYALIGIVSIGFIYALGKGKRWARSSFMWGFILEVISAVVWAIGSRSLDMQPGFMEYLSYIPDLGLQIYALYLLYTWPGARWFENQEYV